MTLRAYVVRRVGQLLVTYWAFLTLLFVLFRLMPGDPTSMFVLEGLSEEARRQIISDLGLDAPLHVQYLEYMGQLLTGDLGTSFIYREPVWGVIVGKFWNTVFLMGPSLAIAIGLGVVAGALIGHFRNSSFETAGIVATITARSSPEFWTGILLLLVFVQWLGWFPSGGLRAAGQEFEWFWAKYLSWEFVYHAVLPILSGVIYYAAVPTLVMRNTMLDVVGSDFIEIKRAEGVPEATILFKHVVRNSILPIVTLGALASALVIGGSVVIETVFNWPGMGREMVRAVNNNDFSLAMGLFFVMGSTVMLMNFLADIAYVFLDPRIQYD